MFAFLGGGHARHDKIHPIGLQSRDEATGIHTDNPQVKTQFCGNVVGNIDIKPNNLLLATGGVLVPIGRVVGGGAHGEGFPGLRL
ncbi:MAG: hypothetical protein Q6K80_11135 [Thermostichus sp. DG_1_6_bins_120]